MPRSKNGTWTRHDIVAAVRNKRRTLSSLARDHGYAPSTFRVALSRRSHEINSVIADFLGEPLHVLWPRWYDKNGKYLPLQEASRVDTDSTSQKRGATADSRGVA